MLTAFHYYEPEEENRIQKGMKESPFFERELELAKNFSQKHPNTAGPRNRCIVCGSRRLSKFYDKWGINYMRCADCYSVMADVTEEDLAEYTQLKELKELRLSDACQEDGLESRRQKWEELLDWLYYRAFRYCGKRGGYSILDYGTRWKGLEQLLRESDFCGTYQLKDSILGDVQQEPGRQADMILALDYIQQKLSPGLFFQEAHDQLSENGLFVLGIKVGSGFDILTLRENNRNVFPYEHVLMPSKEGIEILLSNAGFELLEFTTPGTFDLNYVKSNRDGLAEQDYFIRYFLETAVPGAEADFQRFLQKSGLSSYAQIIARRMD